MFWSSPCKPKDALNSTDVHRVLGQLAEKDSFCGTYALPLWPLALKPSNPSHDIAEYIMSLNELDRQNLANMLIAYCKLACYQFYSQHSLDPIHGGYMYNADCGGNANYREVLSVSQHLEFVDRGAPKFRIPTCICFSLCEWIQRIKWRGIQETPLMLFPSAMFALRGPLKLP